MRSLENHEVDVILFTQAMAKRRFTTNVDPEVRNGLLTALRDKSVWKTLEQAVDEVRAVKKELKATAKNTQQIAAREALRKIMGRVASGLAGVPSALRPSLWLYVWKERKKKPWELVPTGFHKHIHVVRRQSNEATMIDYARGPYVGLFFDPRTVTAGDLEAAIKDILKSFGVKRRSGNPPEREVLVRTITHMLGHLLDNYGPPESSSRDVLDHWKRLRRAWRVYCERGRREDALVSEIQRRFEGQTGRTIDDSTVRKILKKGTPRR